MEIDETEIPQRSKDDPPEGGLGRSGQGKMLVAGTVEVHGHRPGPEHELVEVGLQVLKHITYNMLISPEATA